MVQGQILSVNTEIARVKSDLAQYRTMGIGKNKAEKAAAKSRLQMLETQKKNLEIKRQGLR